MQEPEMSDINQQGVGVSLDAQIVADRNSGWACVIVPKSKELFGTGAAIKVAGTVDGHQFEATMLPIGGGEHMIPIKAATRKVISKDIGDDVHVEITERRS